jgi:hypothetical protein
MEILHRLVVEVGIGAGRPPGGECRLGTCGIQFTQIVVCRILERETEGHADAAQVTRRGFPDVLEDKIIDDIIA